MDAPQSPHSLHPPPSAANPHHNTTGKPVESHTPQAKLPPRFLEFLQENNIDPSIYTESQKLPRHIRLRPRPLNPDPLNPSSPFPPDDVACVEEDLGCKMEPLPWLPRFYSIPQTVKIAGTESYKRGVIFGMDAASAAAVFALSLQPGDHVLDLCAAPGAKLTMISDILGESGSVTAVDISLPRLASTKTLLVKYKAADRCRLFLGDATKFCYPPPMPPTKPAPWKERSLSERVGTQVPEFQDNSVPGECDDEHALEHPLSAHGTASTEEGTSLRTAEQLASSSEASHGQAEEETPGQKELRGTSTAGVNLQDGDSAEAVSGRRKKSRKERRRAKKLREFNALSDGFQADHPELFFVGKKAWQWWDPQKDKTATVTFDSNLASCGGNSKQPENEDRDPQGRESGPDCGGNPVRLYDKVLVDAECTHDGSFKHVLKFEDWGWDSLDRRFLDQQRLDGLAQLQRALLFNGLKMLKKGGLLVYCTCSLTVAQNEDVVRDCLSSRKDVRVLKIEGSENWPGREGGIPDTLRFDPLTSATGGLFVALLTKT